MIKFFIQANDIVKKSIPYLIIFCLFIIVICSIHERKHKKKGFKVAFKPMAKGIIFGKVSPLKVAFSPIEEEGSVFVSGSSGSAKTSAVLIPSLRSWTDGGFLTIDISGDIERNVPENHKFTKLIYKPESRETIPFNIFEPVDKMKEPDKQTEWLINLAYLIMPTDERASDATAYFLEEGRKILIASLLAFFPKYDFPEIVKLISANSYQKLFTLIDNEHIPLASEYLTAFEMTNERNIAGSLQVLQTTLALFRNPIVSNNIRRPKKGEKSITAQSIENHSVYICISDSRLELYSPILRILVAETLNYLAERPQTLTTPLLIALDEFSSLKLNIVPSLRKLRKKHVRILCLTQAIIDLDLTLGKESRIAMLANFSYRLCLRASDVDSQEYWSRLTGTSPNNQNSRAVLPEEFDRLDDNLIMIYQGGWIRLKKNYYFK